VAAMRRREFLQKAAAISLIGVGRAHGQTQNTRAAICIGVNRAGNLPVLHAAVSGAEQMAAWLARQPFDIMLFLDSVRPVRLSDILDKISEIIDKGIYEQLVIYFAGHGCVIHFSERWLLSRAPMDANEAIDVIPSVCLARQSGIKNVVFISDACRSTPDTIQAGNVMGGPVFPNTSSTPAMRTFVDEFYAAHPGQAALEQSVDRSTKNYEGIYTAVFLDAFQHPTQSMVATVDGVRVIPNRRLDDYLRSEVSKRAAAISLQLSQLPESLVQSPDEIYIGRIPEAITPVSEKAPPKTIRDLANFSINQAWSGLKFQPPGAFNEVGAFHTFSASVSQIAEDGSADRDVRRRSDTPVLTQTGFLVSGAKIAGVTVSPGFEARQTYWGGVDCIEISGPRQSGSIAVVFAKETGVVFMGLFAVLSGFIGNVTVGETGVANINYNPAPGSARYTEFEAERSRLDLLRATVASAARFGALNVGVGSEAETFGDRIRVLKSIDPTLGLYAAYAFDRAGQFEKTASVSAFLSGDIGMEFFDTAMLAGKLAGKPPRDRSVAPFAPMLAQGWDLLRVKGVRLDPRLFDAWPRLRPALWTTFAPEDIELVSGLVRES
jgi:hypothetical protein